jgi:hypothetical protein
VPPLEVLPAPDPLLPTDPLPPPLAELGLLAGGDEAAIGGDGAGAAGAGTETGGGGDDAAAGVELEVTPGRAVETGGAGVVAGAGMAAAGAGARCATVRFGGSFSARGTWRALSGATATAPTGTTFKLAAGAIGPGPGFADGDLVAAPTPNATPNATIGSVTASNSHGRASLRRPNSGAVRLGTPTRLPLAAEPTLTSAPNP